MEGKHRRMIFYTDGSAHPNPGPGGFGVVIVGQNGEILETYSKHFEHTTNNEMELLAILYAACRAAREGESALIYSDSAYAINVCSNWMFNWERNNWLKSDGKIPENLDIVKAFFDVRKMIDINFIKVKGHSTNSYNQLADKLATTA